MKKIKLGLDDLAAGEVMTRSQLKQVVGGKLPPATVTQNCANGSVSCTSATGNVGWVWDSTNSFTIGVTCDGTSFTCPTPPASNPQ